MKPVRVFGVFVLAAAGFLLASCGSGGGAAEGDLPLPVATFAFRMQGAGGEQEFRYATKSPEFIARARAQLMLPVTGRNLFPSGAIAAGDGGVNLNWDWHFTDLSLVETSIEVCDGTPAMVQADLPYWLNTVKRFCPWGGYVYAEVTDSYTLRQFAMGQVREVAAASMRIELKDFTDSRCPAAANCVTAGHAEALLSVRIGNGEPQPLTVTLDAGARDQQATLGGYRFTLDSLQPFPINDPIPKAQYRAEITVRRL